MRISSASPFILATCGLLATITTMAISKPLYAASNEAPMGNVELISEVDSCRTWRVMDDLGQGNSYARLEGRTIYFTKCSSSDNTSETPVPVRGDIPSNAMIVAEADGCRVWRISDGEGKIQASAQLEPRYIYFTKCGNLAVPTIESGMR